MYAQHLDGAEVFFEHLALGVEETYLLAHKAADNHAGLDAGETAGLVDECAVAQDGFTQGGPFGTVHPGDDVAVLLLRHFVEDARNLACEVVEVFVFAHIDARGGNHTVDDEGVVAVLCRRDDEACVDGVVTCQCSHLAVAVGPFGVNLLLCELGVFEFFNLRHRHQGAVVLVDGAAVVGPSELIDGPGADDGEARTGKEKFNDVERFAPPRALLEFSPNFFYHTISLHQE